MVTLTKKEKEAFMREALKLAKMAKDIDEVPVGAVIIKGKEIVGRGYNMTETTKDPTAHAEMIAIKSALENLKNSVWKLKGCSMFVTLEPCAMCAGALVLSRIDDLYIGADDEKTGACGSVYDIVSEGKLNHTIKVEKHILEDECSKILKDFFCKLRRK